MAEVAPDDRWDLPLRVLAALHYLALSEDIDPWTDVASTVRERHDWVSSFVAAQSVQTNEVQRSWMLLPCFLELARQAGAERVDLVELGPSAGLNLVWDRYRFRYRGGDWGMEDALLQLTGEERRPVPPDVLRGRLWVSRRVGIDANPIDVATEAGARLLKCFVWADQHDRIDRLDRAIAALRRDPPELVQGDIVEVLPEVLSRRRDDAITIVFETAVLGYLSDDGREAVFATLDRAARESPLGLVRTSKPPDGSNTHYGLWIRLWPKEREAVALANFHGAWLDWLK